MARGKKVPVVMQMEASECGAASLCMVLAYFGKWLPLEQVRSECGVSRDGSNAQNILKAATTYGLEAEAFRMGAEDVQTASFPVIIHWNFNHFVVLKGFKKGKALLNDPERGQVEISPEEFDRSFTGIVLQFQKSARFVPEGQPAGIWRFAVRRLKGAAPSLFLIMAISALVAFFGIVKPLFAKVFLDSILSKKHPEWLSTFTLLFILGMILQFGLAIFERISWQRIAGRFETTSNAEYLWHLLRLPMEFFAQRWIGDILERQKSNANIASNLIKELAPVVINVGLLFSYFGIMLYYSPPLTGIVILTAVLNILVSRWSSKKVMNLSRAEQQSAGRLSGFTMSGIKMIETIKANGAENGFFTQWAGYFGKYYNFQVSITKQRKLTREIPAQLQQIASVAILMLGSYLVLKGQFTFGLLLAFQGFMSAFLGPAGQLIGISETLTTMRAEMERVEDVLQYSEEASHSSPEEPTDSGKLSGQVELKDVTFGYSKLAKPLIQNLSLKLSPGSTVALVGSSGCGKSTVAKLITSLYKPWGGEILFDGKPREQIDDYTFHASVSMVDQDTRLFEDTVANNIRMWDTSIEEFAVVLAARNADIHDMIVDRVGGYEHMLREGGRNFSGGQRQRIEIARVLAGEPTILVLDEATSALDTATEEMVMRNIHNLGCTCIVIAHRLSTIRDCDEILVLDHGVVVERGSHDELFANNGRYTELVSSE